MKTLLFTLLALVVVVAYLIYKDRWGAGLIDEAKTWWKLRTMQVASAIGTIPAAVAVYVEYFGSLWPEATQYVMQLLPASTHPLLISIGAAFAIARMGVQRGLPKWPKLKPSEDPDVPGA